MNNVKNRYKLSKDYEKLYDMNAFIAMCKNCNFEYIQPNIGVDKAESDEQ